MGIDVIFYEKNTDRCLCKSANYNMSYGKDHVTVFNLLIPVSSFL